MTKHILVIEVDTDTHVTTQELANDVFFTMGLSNGVAGGYIGEPEEHAFYEASEIKVFTLEEMIPNRF